MILLASWRKDFELIYRKRESCSEKFSRDFRQKISSHNFVFASLI